MDRHVVCERPDRTIAISPDNASIAELDQAIREKLQEQGYAGPDVYEGTTLIGLRDIREADKKRATSYNVDEIIRWTRSSTLGRRARVSSGQYTRVLALDTAKNEVQIRIEDQVGARDVWFDPRAAHGELYEAGTAKFAVGDRIQLTRTWDVTRGDRLANREIGKIVELDAEGRARIRFGQREVEMNLRQNPHVKLGYAMTSYSAQSATIPRVAVHIDTGDSTIRKLIEKPLLYVGASRGWDEVLVFTDDREALLDPRLSPILRQFDKPMALSDEEIEKVSESVRMRVA